MPDNPPLVSVVIPTYNAPGLLMQTLASVFAQTFTDFEVVVINDGSTDETLAQLQQLQHEDGKLRVVTQVNGGIGVARNRGLDEARGRFVALLDHDDLWLPAKLATQVAYLQEHPQCVACGTLFALSTRPSRPHFALAEVADDQGVVQRPLWHTVQGRDVFQTCTLMIDRERCQGLRYATDRGAIEDVSFHIQLLTRGLYGIAGVEILAIYRVFEGNASKNPQFYYAGIKQLRRIERTGGFDGLPPLQRQDAELWLGHIGRLAVVLQIRMGRRRRGLELYLREWLPQARGGRVRFLLGVPLMLLVPRSLTTAGLRLNRVLGRWLRRGTLR